MTESQTRRVISDLYAMVVGSNLPSSSVRKFLQNWLQRKRVEVEPVTFDRYENIVTQFEEFLGDRAEIDLAHLTKTDVTNFRNSLAARLSPATANLAIKVLRGALSSAKSDGLLNENVAERVKGVAANIENQRRAFTLPELKRILEAADDEWKGMILFGLYTGQRLKDLATLTWQNLDLARGELRFVTGKTGRQQIIPIAGPLQRYIETLPASDNPKQPVFARANGIVERTGLVGMLSGQFYDLMAGVGFVKTRTHKKTGKGRSVKRTQNEISFHCLRHTATSLMKNAGISSAIVQEFIGHDSPEISAHYTHIEMDAMRKAAESMPDILK